VEVEPAVDQLSYLQAIASAVVGYVVDQLSYLRAIASAVVGYVRREGGHEEIEPAVDQTVDD
jgi:hypothetical protein